MPRKHQFPPENISDVHIKRAIGTQRLDWLKHVVQRNAAMVQQIDQMTAEKYHDLLPFHSMVKLAYPRESLEEIRGRLLLCCRVFRDGTPQYCCRLSDFCPFCAVGRAMGVADSYYKHAVGYLQKHIQANYFNLCVKAAASDPAELFRFYKQLQDWRTRLRTHIKKTNQQLHFQRSGELDMELLEAFLHVSVGHKYGRRVFVPHLHIVGMLQNHRVAMNAVKELVTEFACRDGYRVQASDDMRVRFHPTARAKKTLGDVSRTMRYGAIMVKTRRISVEEHFHCCLTLPEGVRQFTGKGSKKPPVTARYAINRHHGQCSIRLTAEDTGVTVEKI